MARFRFPRPVHWTGLVCLGLLGCAPRAERVVHSPQDAARVELRHGQILAITLEAQPAAGYRWEAQLPAQDLLRALPEGPTRAQSEALGSPAWQTLRFRAIGRGKSLLIFHYRRPWEAGTPPLKTLTLTVVIR